MISDVLSDAVAEINRYLEDEVFKDVYVGELREEILILRDSMERMYLRLDHASEVEP